MIRTVGRGTIRAMQSLRALIRTYPSVLLGYSGGVDSAFLAVVLRQELGKERMQVHRWLKRYNIDLSHYRID